MILFSAASAVALPALGTDCYWRGGALAGNYWEVAANWRESLLPETGDNVYIPEPFSFSFSTPVTRRAASPPIALGTIVISGPTIGPFDPFDPFGLSDPPQLILDPTSNSLTSVNLFVGREDPGALLHQGGSNTVTGTLNVSNAKYDLSGGRLVVGNQTRVGHERPALFTQFDGTHITHELYIGSASVGRYDLFGGAIAADNVYLGGDSAGTSGTGTVNLTGGTMTLPAAGAIKVFNANSIINLNGGAVTGGALILPNWNRLNFINGTLNLTGGASSNPGALILHGTAFSPAILNLSNGSLTAAGLDVGPGGGGQAALNLTNATVTMSGSGGVGINAASSITFGPGGLLASFTLEPENGPASMLTFAGGTWRHTGPTLTFLHDFLLNAGGGTIDVQQPATILTVAGNASGPGGLTKAGPGTLRFTGSLAATSNGLTVAAGTFDAAANGTQAFRSLTLQPSARAVVSLGVLSLGNNTAPEPLTIAPSATLDLRSRGLVIDPPTPGEDAGIDAVLLLRGLIVQGYHAGDWNGKGITSSVAAADPSRAVGYARASELFNVADATPDFFLGAPVDANSGLARLTLAGDANLDGAVNFADLIQLAQHYNTTVSASTQSWWFNGDFTYDGIVNFNDLVKLAQNYNTALAATPIPGAPADLPADLVAALAGAPPVPESSAPLGVGAACAFVASARRRRRRD
jgi:hypothetical protein